MEHMGEISQLQALERRIDELSVELSTQVSLAMAGWREKEAELLRMLQSQQEELQQLRVQQVSLHGRLSPQRCQSALGGDRAPVTSIESQWQESITELRKLQQDHTQLLAGESQAAVDSDACSSLQQEVVTTTLTLLKELKDERGIVVDMLDNVKKEKCEVIAMMHTFATTKAEAMEELDGFRHAARDEISAFAVRALSSPSATVTVGHSRQSEVTSARGDGRDAADHELPTEPVRIAAIHGPRAGSHTTLCPASLQAPAVAFPTGIHGFTWPPVGQQQQSGASGVAGAAPGAVSGAAPCAAGSHDQRRNSTGTAPAEPPVRSACSPVRQYSAGVSATRLLSINTAYSPPMLPRPVIATAETQKSPVRRFISGSLAQVGGQETVGTGPGGAAWGNSISATWTTVSQSPLIR